MLKKNKPYPNFLDFTHDRDKHYKKTSDELFSWIEQFAEKDEFLSLYNFYQKRHGIPEKILKKQLKRIFCNFYVYKKGKFSEELKLKFIISHSVKSILALIYALFYSKKSDTKKKYTLIIDEINDSLQIKRFSKLINLFKKDNVLIVATNSNVIQDLPHYNFRIISSYKYFERIEVLKFIFHEFKEGFWINLKLSLQLKINFFRIAFTLNKYFLNYKSLFSSSFSDFIIQERHYTTSAIKNYLFKKMGGIASTSIQKNIIQSDSGSFYTDIDWLFSLGNRGLERIISYGGRVDRIIPVGSMFMEYYWFTNLPKIIKKYDLILIDLNVIHAYNRMDSFKHFMDDYYNCNRWLVRLKKEYPSFRIGIKHHANASFDKIQNEIILDSNIEMIDKNLDSYEIAFNSHCAISYGSTMGFELSAHGLPFFFIDPGFRCTSLPDKEGDFISNLRVQTYEEFRDSVIEVLSKKDKTTTWLKNPDDLCLESSNVSNRIYNSLHSK